MVDNVFFLKFLKITKIVVRVLENIIFINFLLEDCHDLEILKKVEKVWDLEKKIKNLDIVEFGNISKGFPFLKVSFWSLFFAIFTNYNDFLFSFSNLTNFSAFLTILADFHNFFLI